MQVPWNDAGLELPSTSIDFNLSAAVIHVHATVRRYPRRFGAFDSSHERALESGTLNRVVQCGRGGEFMRLLTCLGDRVPTADDLLGFGGPVGRLSRRKQDVVDADQVTSPLQNHRFLYKVLSTRAKQDVCIDQI